MPVPRQLPYSAAACLYKALQVWFLKKKRGCMVWLSGYTAKWYHNMIRSLAVTESIHMGLALNSPLVLSTKASRHFTMRVFLCLPR
jgi:hypothetical protein